jgi:hypothetical protein
MWPRPPAWWSFSSLTNVEECPRRWALERGSYPQIWDRQGYPRLVGTATLRGQVIHQVIEEVLNDVTSAETDPSCQVLGERLFHALRRQGGWSVLIDRVISAVIRSVEDNPRLEHRKAALENELRSSSNAIRTLAQGILVQIPERVRSPSLPQRSGSPGSNPTRGGPTPLVEGMHPEVVLQAPGLGWRGVADLVDLRADSCGIVDYKTGKRKENHQLQARIYALLWYLDHTHNPNRIRVSDLTLVYHGSVIRFEGPTQEELESLERELTLRTGRAKEQLSTTPPAAKPMPEACQWCGVRQNCDVYWEQGTQDLMKAAADDAFVDVEVRVGARNGDRSWHGSVATGAALPPGTHVVIRVPIGREFLRNRITPGGRLRILSAQLMTVDIPASKPVIALTSRSELFSL